MSSTGSEPRKAHRHRRSTDTIGPTGSAGKGEHRDRRKHSGAHTQPGGVSPKDSKNVISKLISEGWLGVTQEKGVGWNNTVESRGPRWREQVERGLSGSVGLDQAGSGQG